MSIIKIQSELKAPKGQFNSFGKYKYRSCEDIVEAVKPLLSKYKASLNLSDEVVEIGGRGYVKARATIYFEDGAISQAIGYAREAETKKGMDEAQITGTASSYARKCALNGLLAIDDTKDADTNEHKAQVETQPIEKINEQQVADLTSLINEVSADAKKFCEYMGVSSVGDIARNEFNKATKALEKKRKAA